MTAKTPATVILLGFSTPDGKMDIISGNYFSATNTGAGSHQISNIALLNTTLFLTITGEIGPHEK
jgi:hypothetical protein